MALSASEKKAKRKLSTADSRDVGQRIGMTTCFATNARLREYILVYTEPNRCALEMTSSNNRLLKDHIGTHFTLLHAVASEGLHCFIQRLVFTRRL